VRVIALLLAAVAVGLSNLAAAIGIGVTGVNTRVRLQVGLVFGVFEAGMPVVGLLIGQRFATEMDKAVRWPGAILLMIVGAQGLVRSIREGRRSAAEANRRPGTANPGAASPGSANLGSAHLGAVDLGAADLGAADLGTADRGEADPGTVNPGTADPGTADPGAANLGEATPGAADAGVGRPGSGLSPGVSSLLASPSPRLGRLLATGLVLSMDNLVVGFALGTYGVSVAAGAILIGSISVAMSLVGLELGGLLGRWAGRRSEQMSGLILILVGAAIAGGALG
jgi:putative Mn2+ efflux pump MntP